MSQSPTLDLVTAYHLAWTSGDIEAAMRLVDDDIVCRAPGVDLHGEGAYAQFLGGFAPMLTGIGDIAEFAGGEQVTLFYYPQTAATTTTPAAELFTVRDARIAESVLIFDRLSYAPAGE
ncbi:nuclear transport factor 2 family protein [Brachybacterium saurashtrense]|uniref:Nuclear transport factor 2 family protein n=1 Tax=Brachybacterium saurashtrense TaxID=556288 RepID=A0A345YPL7_9MICO|nr:nuclear transport factor 2 family protein [Brachybacterium saurashtrense]AXK45869.1 nuclear transport factor 2 family protein [Brachybacterium saurashtrense]RRR24888.1 nuclear transport factor 2 family protein [Brachybacterium saurashtrense]